jgi:hypothetical protein
MNYIKDLEDRIEELQQKLAVTLKENEELLRIKNAHTPKWEITNLNKDVPDNDKRYSFRSDVGTLATLEYNEKTKCWEINNYAIRSVTISNHLTVELAMKSIERCYDWCIK